MIIRLRCVSEEAAQQCAAFLAEHGIIGVESDGTGLLIVSGLDAPSVTYLAEDALARGWAYDEDCAQIIADMSRPASEGV